MLTGQKKSIHFCTFFGLKSSSTWSAASGHFSPAVFTPSHWPKSAVLSQLFTFNLQDLPLSLNSHSQRTLIMFQPATCQAAKYTAGGPPSPPAFGSWSDAAIQAPDRCPVTEVNFWGQVGGSEEPWSISKAQSQGCIWAISVIWSAPCSAVMVFDTHQKKKST